MNTLNQVCILIIVCFYLKNILVAQETIQHGSIYFSDGSVFSGKITTNREIYFRDIFLSRSVQVPLSQVYMLECLPEMEYPYPENNPSSGMVYRRFILAVHTWTGQSYWGRLNLGISLTLHNKKRYSFFLPQAQITQKEEESHHTEKILATANPKHRIASRILRIIFNHHDDSAPKLLSIRGTLKFVGVFTQIYALHRDLGILFPGILSPDKASYEIQRVMPGNYQIFFVGEKEIVFGMAMPERRTLYDKIVYPNEDRLSLWVQKRSLSSSRKELVYATGRLSQTTALIVETKSIADISIPGQKPTLEYRLYIIVCYFHADIWHIRQEWLLYAKKISREIPPPTLLYDEYLENIFVQNPTTFNYPAY